MKKLKPIGLFLLGILVGCITSTVFVGGKAAAVYQDQYMMSVMDQANVALQLSSHKQDALQKTIESSLPSYALTIHNNFKDHSQSVDALWMIKAYYDRSKTPLPPEIKSIIAALPPKPPTACQLRLRALDKQQSQKRPKPKVTSAHKTKTSSPTGKAN